MTATVSLTTYYLELLAAPAPLRPLAPRSQVTIRRLDPISVGYYRYLYDQVGRRWQWTDRKQLSDEELFAIVGDAQVHVHVLHVGGVPAGYLELDGRIQDEIQIAYFGLAPAWIGQGLGSYFLSWGIAHAFASRPSRLWVHTCSLDHPAALAAYQRAGFSLYDTITEAYSPEELEELRVHAPDDGAP